MNRLTKILTLGLAKRRAWQLPLIAAVHEPRATLRHLSEV